MLEGGLGALLLILTQDPGSSVQPVTEPGGVRGGRWGGRGPWAPPRVMLPRWGRMTDPGESSWQGCARTCSSDFLESSEVTRRWPPLGQVVLKGKWGKVCLFSVA